MQVETVEVQISPGFMENCYILADAPDATHAVVVDPGAEPQRILSALGDRTIEAVVLTHRHFDHIGALPQILRHADVPLIAHTLEAEAINEHFRKPLAALRSLFAPVLVSKTVDEGDFISVGDARLSVLHTPGHTIGSMCLYDAEEGVLIAGDTLFFEAVGRTDLPTGDVRQQRGSLKKLSALPEDTRVYPGHDQATTIAHEKEQGFLRDWV